MYNYDMCHLLKILNELFILRSSSPYHEYVSHGDSEDADLRELGEDVEEGGRGEGVDLVSSRLRLQGSHRLQREGTTGVR